MAQIYDNLNQKFIDGLRGILGNLGVKRADFCVGYFNLRGWKCIYDLIDKLVGQLVYEEKDEKEHLRFCRLLIGMQHPSEELIQALYSVDPNKKVDSETVQRAKRKIVEDFRKQLVIGVPSADDEKALRELKRQLEEEKVAVRLYLKNPLHAKLYLAYRPDDNFNPIQTLMGSSNLTFSGLKGQGELDAEIADSTNARTLADWFEDKWNEKFCIDITEELKEVLDESWACIKDLKPYYIYLKTAYHLSQEARTGINEYQLPSVFRSQLFDFQQTAVKIAARHLEKRGGAMIGDVVGLGKTITACAVAKVYEMQHACSTLILCPANLVDMWESYVKEYDLKADVKSVAEKFDPQNMRYYRLVIIDESHNLRNSNGKRYKNIKDLISYQGCKVLLLTATPYNKEYKDLSNQLKLFITEDDDLGIRPEDFIKEIGGTDEFSIRYSDDFIRSIKAFEHSTQPNDWQSLMRMFLVRRTRTFIKNNYAFTDEQNGRKYLQFPDGTKSYFPDRDAKAIKFDVSKNDQFTRLYSEEMMEKLGSLKLPRYGLVKYIDVVNAKNANKEEKQIIDNLTRAGNTLMGFCRTMFMKRLDSCGYSFLLSIYRHILRNAIYIYALKTNQPVPIGDDGNLPDDYIEDQDNETLIDSKIVKVKKNGASISFPIKLEEYIEIAKNYYPQIRKNISWLKADYFNDEFIKALQKDCKILIDMLNCCAVWDAKEDKKLDSLEVLINKKHKGEKILVFTQFSDTANYIAEQLQQRGIKKVACVTGDTENATYIVSRFSPESNNKHIAQEEQLDVLVATDVLSEGQNLQDSHIVVNYDLPWAIIRLIQRAGRVDRIGQKSDKIQCYSFFPADGIDKIIKLRKRLNDRINQNAKVVGSDEIFFEGNEQNIKDLYNEKNGILDEEDDGGDVDLASYAYQIWLNATKKNKKLEKLIPALSNVIYSSKANTFNKKDEGVITYAKTKDGNDMLTWMCKDGKIVTQSQKTILDSMACTPDEPPVLSLQNHHKLVSDSVKIIKDSPYSAGGVLGSRFSTKYQLYTKLYNFWKANEKTPLLVPPNLKSAIDDIYNYTLKEKAKDTLSKFLRHDEDIQSIIDLVLEYKDSDDLVIKKDDDNSSKGPQIICSMGLVNQEKQGGVI